MKALHLYEFDFGKIELGTANFGLDYGITNIKGQLPEETS